MQVLNAPGAKTEPAGTHRVVVITGCSGVGKTQLCRRLSGPDFEEAFVPTIGIDCFRTEIGVGVLTVPVVLMDLTGRNRSMYVFPAVVVVCYSVDDVGTTTDLEHFIAAARSANDAAVVVVGTKIDRYPQSPLAVSENPLMSARSSGARLSPQELTAAPPAVVAAEEVCGRHYLRHYFTSAKTGDGAREMLLQALALKLEEQGVACGLRFVSGGVRLPLITPS